jgi:cellulose synthase/poly-beta-1,6-N-acetylglucosamine synthase-like glycosyltransferase
MMMPVMLIFGGCTFLQILMYGIFFSRLVRYKPLQFVRKNLDKPAVGVSVIICARNEEGNIRQHLGYFLTQNYAAPFEVVVVDDGSTDGSRAYLEELEQIYPNLRTVRLSSKAFHGKKEALTLGISVAKYDVLLLSDADCRPAGPDWLAAMAGALAPGREIVLGFSPYARSRGMLNAFIRFEGIYTAIQYFSFALAGIPYMGVGRNLMYRKGLFLRSGGFEAHRQRASGDDDLFVNMAANQSNTAINLEPGAFVWSLPQTTWRGYFRQKTRHFSTGIHYRLIHKALLAIIALTHSLHYASGILLVFMPGYGEVAITGYLVRIVVVLAVNFALFRKFSAPDLWKWAPLTDALLPLYYLVFSWGIFAGRSPAWKDEQR